MELGSVIYSMASYLLVVDGWEGGVFVRRWADVGSASFIEAGLLWLKDVTVAFIVAPASRKNRQGRQ